MVNPQAPHARSRATAEVGVALLRRRAANLQRQPRVNGGISPAAGLHEVACAQSAERTQK